MHKYVRLLHHYFNQRYQCISSNIPSPRKPVERGDSNTTKFHILDTNESFFLLIRVFTRQRIFHRAQVRSPLCSARLSTAIVSLLAPANYPLRTHPPSHASAITNRRPSTTPVVQCIVHTYRMFIVSDGHRANHIHDSELYYILRFYTCSTYMMS